MEVVRDETWTRPTPNGEAEYGEFYAACAEGRLLVQRCPVCDHRQFYPRPICTECGATPEWLECAGTGTVHTFTIIRQYRAEPFGSELPYALAMIDGFSVGYWTVKAASVDPKTLDLIDLTLEDGQRILHADRAEILINESSGTAALRLIGLVALGHDRRLARPRRGLPLELLRGDRVQQPGAVAGLHDWHDLKPPR